MTNRHWLKREVPAWVKEKLISEEEGKALLARYRKGEPGAYREAFFVMALVCLLGGLGFLGAGLWNGLTQDERFLLALVPLPHMIFSFAQDDEWRLGIWSMVKG